MNSNQPKPAPTAEEQPELPPLKHMNQSQYDSWVRKAEDPDWFEHRYHQDKQDRALVSFARELRDMRNQLTAALRSNREKDAEIEKARSDAEGLRKILRSTEDAWRSQEKELAEKDAKIAELTQQAKTALAMCKENSGRLITAEAQLRAVSEALEDYDRVRITPGRFRNRVRSIVDGKD